MSNMRTLSRGAATAAIALILTFAAWASAGDILDDWMKVQPPPPPELKAVKLDGAVESHWPWVPLIMKNEGSEPIWELSRYSAMGALGGVLPDKSKG